MTDKPAPIRTVQITAHQSAQGPLVRTLPNGRGVVLVDGREIEGYLL